MGPCAVVLMGLLMAGVHYARLHGAAAALIGVAPAAAFSARSLAARRHPGTPAAIAGLALEALLLAGAIAVQVATSAAPYEGY
jgi:hypothetical protein